jgi:DNA-binding winged helix-turn-helix (wHTH) protein
VERDGEEARVEPKAMQVLEYLAERAGEVVSRQELESAIWSGTVVGYEAVTNAVIKLRKALQDDARDPHIIETISKGGYRLIAEVIPASGHTEKRPGQLEPKLAAALHADAAVPPEVHVRSAWRNPIVAFAAAILGIAIGVSAWFYYDRPDVEPASIDNMAFPLPKEPSIAVLPFENLSGGNEQDFLADGLTADLTFAPL